ncbi:unnamed protein product [Cochlearia groenlandica]
MATDDTNVNMTNTSPVDGQTDGYTPVHTTVNASRDASGGTAPVGFTPFGSAPVGSTSTTLPGVTPLDTVTRDLFGVRLQPPSVEQNSFLGMSQLPVTMAQRGNINA